MTKQAIAVTVGLVMSLGMVAPGHANDDHGQSGVPVTTYGKLSARWWQWARSFPLATSPLLEGVGAPEPVQVDCSRGQRGPVWFLAGTFEGTALRKCTVPHGKTLFYPLLNFVFFNEPGDCDRPEGCSIAEKRQLLSDAQNRTCNLSSTLDGTPTAFSPRTPTVRTQSPAFPLFLRDRGIFDAAAISDGMWVRLPPLPRGNHELRFGGLGGGFCDPGSGDRPFFVRVIYELTVEGSRGDHDDDDEDD